MLTAKRHGTTIEGEKHGCAKLDWNKVAEIRSQKGLKSHVKLAEEFGISASQVCQIQKGKKWKLVVEETK